MQNVSHVGCKDEVEIVLCWSNDCACDASYGAAQVIKPDMDQDERNAGSLKESLWSLAAGAVMADTSMIGVASWQC